MFAYEKTLNDIKQKRRMLKHPAPCFYKFSQCNFLQENIGLLNFKNITKL